jgi:hypothetical protein
MRLIKHTVFEDEELFEVEGETGIYIVRKIGDEYTCTCPAFTYRKGCKHIEFVKGGCREGS